METQIQQPPAGSVWGGLRKGTMASASTFVWQKAVLSSSHPDARQFNSFPYLPGSFQDAAPALELRGSESKQVHAWAL